MGFLEKLYNGEYRPIDEETPDNKEFKDAMGIINETATALCATFSETQRELWDRNDAASLVVEEQIHVQAFKQGFRIAMEMMQDDEIRDRLPKLE